MRFEDINLDRYHSIELDKFRERKFQPEGIEKLEFMIYHSEDTREIKRLRRIKDYLQARSKITGK